MGPWRAKQKAAQDAERARIEAERRKQAEKEQKALAKKTGDKTLLDLPVVVPKVVVEDATKVSGISYQSVPKFEVVNPELVPDEYWVIDEVKIGKAVRAASGNITIPGVRVWMEEVVKSAAYQSRR